MRSTIARQRGVVRLSNGSIMAVYAAYPANNAPCMIQLSRHAGRVDVTLDAIGLDAAMNGRARHGVHDLDVTCPATLNMDTWREIVDLWAEFREECPRDASNGQE